MFGHLIESTDTEDTKYPSHDRFGVEWNTLMKKRLLHHRMRYLFGDYSYFIWLWGLKTGWLAGFIVFLCIVCSILFNVSFGTIVMILIDNGEIDCMSIPKCHWVVILVNLTKQAWFFCMMLFVGTVLCMPGQYWVFPPLAVIITTRRRGMLATRRCRHSTAISAHLCMNWACLILGH